MHLHPQSLYRLMLTNKGVYEVIKGNRRYFERYAVFLLFRKRAAPSSTSRPFSSIGHHANMEAFVIKAMFYIREDYYFIPESLFQIVLMFHTSRQLYKTTIKYCFDSITLSVIKQEIQIFHKQELGTEFRKIVFQFVSYLRDQDLPDGSIRDLRESLNNCFRKDSCIYASLWWGRHRLIDPQHKKADVSVVEHRFEQWLRYMKNSFLLPMAKRYAWEGIVYWVKRLVPYWEIDDTITNGLISDFFTSYSSHKVW